jgi:hypothetical protein
MASVWVCSVRHEGRRPSHGCSALGFDHTTCNCPAAGQLQIRRTGYSCLPPAKLLGRSLESFSGSSAFVRRWRRALSSFGGTPLRSQPPLSFLELRSLPSLRHTVGTVRYELTGQSLARKGPDQRNRRPHRLARRALPVDLVEKLLLDRPIQPSQVGSRLGSVGLREAAWPGERRRLGRRRRAALSCQPVFGLDDFIEPTPTPQHGRAGLVRAMPARGSARALWLWV